ncbi:MAG: CHASE2 domain-containing protein [Phormidesmis sp. RL_2_1]|nr:CHASE2 domain-containing protein [Phormidesmis sp. RL_2_1]
MNSQVVIITIDEPDIQAIGQFPIPDAILAEAITSIAQYQPRLIGLDIYRDFAVEPGHDELVRVFRQTPNLIGIEKAVSPSISPPAVLAEDDRIGFADQIFDLDGTVRRALLSIEDTDGQLKLSFPLKLASMYLAEENIVPQPLPENPDVIRFGKQVLKPFQAYDGGYVRADAGGYQVLLNYTGTQAQFSTFSLTQLLANQVPMTALQDRIVLIGSTASTVNDVLITPYTRQFTGYMAGVTVHANTVSLLLNAALEGRPLLRVWPKSVEMIWIFVWTATGAVMAGRLRRSPRMTAVAVGMGGAILLGSAYGLFLAHWWIPVIPAGMGLIMAAVTVPVVTSRQLERMILEKTTGSLLRKTYSNPAVAQIAIAYLKQSENEKIKFG